MNDRAESEFTSRERESTLQKHSDSLARRKLTAGINAALLELYPAPIASQTLLELFEHRASLASIKAWRFGWMIPPAWASELLNQRLDARKAALDRVKIVFKRGPGPGERGAAHWRQWRARQAEERDKKEKAAQKAALRDSGVRDD